MDRHEQIQIRGYYSSDYVLNRSILVLASDSKPEKPKADDYSEEGREAHVLISPVDHEHPQFLNYIAT